MTDQRKPNILVIMADQHAPRVTGAYGHPFIQTPNLDRLAERGVRFDAAYCNSPVCAPSRVAFLSGRLPHNVGCWTNSQPFQSDVPTWAHYLSVAGYQTALMGKQHFTGPDQKHGFEVRVGGEIHSPRIRPYSLCTPEPFEDVIARFFKTGMGRSAYVNHDYEVADHAIEFLQGHQGRDPDRPFALCASFFAPHHPFIVEQGYLDRYWPEHGDLADVPDGFADRLHPAWRAQYDFYQLQNVDPETARRVRATYYALTTFVDGQIGRVLDALEQTGQAENTIIIYTTDHGEHLGEHAMWFKKTFYDESALVPLMISWPGVFPQNELRKQVVSLVDVAASIVEWGGGPEPEDMDGSSLDGIVRDASAPWADVAFSEFVGVDEMMLYPEQPIAGAPRRMLRSGRYKLNYFGGGGRPELYDLETDPGEWNDLSQDPAHKGILADLTARITANWDPELIEREVRRAVRRCKIIMDAESTYLGSAPKAMSLVEQS